MHKHKLCDEITLEIHLFCQIAKVVDINLNETAAVLMVLFRYLDYNYY